MRTERVPASALAAGDVMLTCEGDELRIKSVTRDGDRVVIQNASRTHSFVVKPIRCIPTTMFVRLTRLEVVS